MSKKAQWILYNQCNIRYIAEGITDIVYLFYTGNRVVCPAGTLTFNIRSRIAEYAIAKAFLEECLSKGYVVHWIEASSYRAGLQEVWRRLDIEKITLMRPSEEYLARRIESWIGEFHIEIVSNAQFLISEEEFRTHFTKPPVMERFYRYMRTTRNILIASDGKPTGGKWNYDHENRSFDAKHTPSWDWKPVDTAYILAAKEYFNASDVFFCFPVTRGDALRLLTYFITEHGADFGRLEDAMYSRDTFVHHSLLSTALNFGLLHPSEVIEAILGADMPLPSKEGYIRQIIGWREYMRQFYLFYYDDIFDQNILRHTLPIPPTWWSYSGKAHAHEITSMNCVDTVLRRVQSENYSHHIERLMVIGNYALLMGYAPREVNRWFYEMYIDAFEWVVTPNVMAMSQFSDGGRLATKPYISGGNYLQKMSDFCQGCQYSVREKTCPMTHLYWDFVDRNRSLFVASRTPYVLQTLARLDIEKVRSAKEKFLIKVASTHPL